MRTRAKRCASSTHTCSVSRVPPALLVWSGRVILGGRHGLGQHVPEGKTCALCPQHSFFVLWVA